MQVAWDNQNLRHQALKRPHLLKILSFAIHTPRMNNSSTDIDMITEGEMITEFSSSPPSTEFSTFLSSIPTPPSVGFKYSHRIIVASMYVAIAIVGIPGNTLVIATTILQKKLQTTTNVLVVNLALADLMTCLCIPLHIPGLINPSGEYPLPDAVCGAVAGIMYSSIVCGIETMAAIGFVRWYVITRSLRGQHGINSPCGLAIVVGVCWVAAFLVICLPPIHGVGHLGYSRVLATCSSNPGPIKLLMSTVFTVGCLLLIALVYSTILIYVLRHTRRFRAQFVAKYTQSMTTRRPASRSFSSP